jgi:hypothetical protein
MFARPRSFSVLYGIQRSFLNFFYLVSVIAVFWLIFHILHEVLDTGGKIIIPVSIGYLVIIVLVYSMIHIISYIPANLAGAFDPIKNGIAEGSIAGTSELSGLLADFMINFFNFSFFDIVFARVQLEGDDPADNSWPDELVEEGEILKEAAASLESTTWFKKIKTPSGTFHIYIIPLIFGERRLGYIVAGSRQKLWRIFVSLLDEFENDYLDDQVVHLLNR